MDIRVLLVITGLLIAFIGEPRVIGCAASMQLKPTSAEQPDRFVDNAAEEKINHMKIPKDQILEVRLPSNTLLKYTSYKDVSILHFRMPPDTRRAMFTFKAYEESKSAFLRKCRPRDVSLHLKAGSYPVISPENITFPRNFLNSEQRFHTHTLQLVSDEVKQHIVIDGPQVGSWFAVAFISWTDPNTDRIEQQGLAVSCDTLLLAEMSVSPFQPIIINNGQVHYGNLSYIANGHNIKRSAENSSEGRKLRPGQNNYANLPASLLAKKASSKYTAQEQTFTPEKESNLRDGSAKADCINEHIYKFYVPRNIGVASGRISFAHPCMECHEIVFRIQANAFPYVGLDIERSYIHSTFIKPNQTNDVLIKFNVQPTTWHYAVLAFVNAGHVSPKDDAKKAINNHTKLNRNEGAAPTACIHVPLQLQINYTEFTDEPKKTDAITTKADEETNATNDTEHVTNAWRPYKFRNMDFYPLLRQTYREFFMFDYDLVPDENGTVPAILNLTAGVAAGFAFSVGEVYDIGGTLTFAVSMKQELKKSLAEKYVKEPPFIPYTKDRSGVLAEKLVGIPVGHNTSSDPHNLDPKSLPRSNQTVIVCMYHGEPGIPTWPDKCRYGDRLLPASSIINNTDSNTSTGLIHVPFPESGQWYITMGLYCHGAETAARASVIDNVKDFVKRHAKMLDAMQPPCACAVNQSNYQECLHNMECLAELNETETLKIKECLMDSKCISNHFEMTEKFAVHHKLATEQHFALDNCNNSVVFTVSSSPCVAGRCGRFGRCYHYMSGGFVFSTCVCMKGYRGWDCMEDSQVPSSISILMGSLLLTLSNLLFLPSIYMAVRRQFYTEGVIYFFAMFFSIFYHACDSGEDEYSFCLVKIGVLQFCDFYCGLLAIWVTLVAMSHVRQQFVSLLHMLGAILLAFGTELNKQSLWVFLAPALIGICLISASWGMRCYKSRKWFPARKYLTVYMPIGAVFVMVGLVCYAFLQTKQNYHIVHSIWHMVMALSILCLLPSPDSFIPKC